jgi:predicted RNase H-like HicB family nuclease
LVALKAKYIIAAVEGGTAMSYQVLVEKVPDGIFSATVIGLSDCVAEGLTKEEALENASVKLKERLARSELITIEGAPSPSQEINPWLEIHGSLRDDPTFEDFVSEIDRHRRKLDGEGSLT